MVELERGRQRWSSSDASVELLFAVYNDAQTSVALMDAGGYIPHKPLAAFWLRNTHSQCPVLSGYAVAIGREALSRRSFQSPGTFPNSHHKRFASGFERCTQLAVALHHAAGYEAESALYQKNKWNEKQWDRNDMGNGVVTDSALPDDNMDPSMELRNQSCLRIRRHKREYASTQETHTWCEAKAEILCAYPGWRALGKNPCSGPFHL
ncbi:hypothetical protein BC832DRAFT_542874 [Gaertneriomyces semiglobifer]|nr:hypothetical protein BC832DRAFT_542874 [Gaertneriomyces semiglobifer]